MGSAGAVIVVAEHATTPDLLSVKASFVFKLKSLS